MVDKPLSRRKLLGTLGGVNLAGLAGCIGPFTTSAEKQHWEENDAYPDDPDRNRDCNLRSMNDQKSTVRDKPSAYTVSGRDDLPGTNQHVDVKIETEQKADIFVTDQDKATKRYHETRVDTHDIRDNRKTAHRLSNDIFFHFPEYAEFNTTEYQKQIQVPDEDSYTILVTHPNEEGYTDFQEFTVDYRFDCSYYLSFEEAQEHVYVDD